MLEKNIVYLIKMLLIWLKKLLLNYIKTMHNVRDNNNDKNKERIIKCFDTLKIYSNGRGKQLTNVSYSHYLLNCLRFNIKSY